MINDQGAEGQRRKGSVNECGAGRSAVSPKPSPRCRRARDRSGAEIGNYGQVRRPVHSSRSMPDPGEETRAPLADSYDGCPALAATNKIFAFLCALSDFRGKTESELTAKARRARR